MDEMWFAIVADDDKQMVFSEDFAPKGRIRKSGFYPEEEAALKVFALSDKYPRQITVERTGTTYRLNSTAGARRLLKRLRFGSEEYRWNLTEGRPKPTKNELKNRKLFR